MDAKITKQRLSRLLSFDWLKILACVVALIFGWLMVFEVTETRISPSQKFTVFNHTYNRQMTTDTIDKISQTVNEGVFSYEVMETDYQDLSKSDIYVYELVSSLLGVSDGDVMLVPNLPNPSSDQIGEDENGNPIYKYTYPESFVNPYRKYMTDLNPETEGSYFYELERYLNSFYTDGWQNADSIDKTAIEAEFRARIARTKDKRFRTEAKIAASVTDEIERVQKYRDAYEKFNGFLDEGLICFNSPSSIRDDTEVSAPYDGVLSLNICPDETKMSNLKHYFSYRVGIDFDEAGNAINFMYSAQDMSVMFFYGPDTEKSFEYESLLYVVDLIEKGRTK